jgi:lauroyl/myristoyl acyltransferase
MPLSGPLYEVARLLALLPLSWLAPIERLWPLACALRSGREHGGDPKGATEIVMAHLLGNRADPSDAAALFRRWQDRSLELTMQILAFRRPGRHWRPRIHLEGAENLAAALRRDKGVILWISDFVYSHLPVALAIRDAGFGGLVYLSRPEHGFSVSPFAVKFLNPLWIATENRFLAERVIIENDDARPALKALRDRLARNGIIAITVAETGRRTQDVRFLRGMLRIATGPAHLARTTGAPLLPVFPVRNEQGAYEISIGPALPVEDGADPPYSAALRAYAAMLEPFVLHHPDQWNGWIALGRLVEMSPAFVARFECDAALARDLERLGLYPGIPARAAG